MKLAEFLKTEKKKQAEFGVEIGIEQSHVSKLASGEVLPTLMRAWEIEVATGGAVTLYDWLPDICASSIGQAASNPNGGAACP